MEREVGERGRSRMKKEERERGGETDEVRE